MSQLLFALGLLLHTFGLIVFAGGEIWVSIMVAKSQSSPKPHGKAFVMELLKPISITMWIGGILLAVGGIIRMVGMNAVGLWGDLGTLWGTIMLFKHLLVVIITVSALLISLKVAPTMGKNAPGPGEEPSEIFLKNSKRLEKLSQTNLFLTMLVVVISVAAVAL